MLPRRIEVVSNFAIAAVEIVVDRDSVAAGFVVAVAGTETVVVAYTVPDGAAESSPKYWSW